MKRSRPRKALPFLQNAFLFLTACALYILAFPTDAFPGFAPFALLAFSFFLLLFERLEFKAILAAGVMAGVLIHLALTYWLGNYHPSALVVTMLAGALRFAALAGALKLASRANGWQRWAASISFMACMPAVAAWGYLGFPYATLPYPFFNSRFALFLAGIGGVTLVNILIGFANYCFFRFLAQLGTILDAERTSDTEGLRRRNRFLHPPLLLPGLVSLVLALLFIPGSRSVPASNLAASVKQVSQPRPKTEIRSLRIVLIQPNRGAGQESLPDYEAMFAALQRLSERAREYEPDLLIMHETAIVPAIAWHLRFRPERETYEFAKRVDEYLASYPCAVLLGNNWVPPSETEREKEFNAAVLYADGGESRQYRKVKLVPFSEYFPYEKQLPAVYRWLVSRFGMLRRPGAEQTVFQYRDYRFAAPICFEDSFSSYFASFTEPDFFAVLTEDSWSHSEAMQRQHAAMSAFRAAETGTIVLRAANTGKTMAIEANGHIAASLASYTEDILVVDILPSRAGKNLFMRGGRYTEAVLVAVSIIALILLLVTAVRRRFKAKRNFG